MLGRGDLLRTNLVQGRVSKSIGINIMLLGPQCHGMVGSSQAH